MSSSIFAAIIIIVLIAVFDWHTLRQPHHVKDRWIYGAFTGIGFTVMALYLSIFELPGPLDLLQAWLQPYVRWLIP